MFLRVWGQRGIDEVSGLVSRLGWQDVADIALMAVLCYNVLLLVRGTKAFQALAGLGVLGLISLGARRAELILTSWVLQNLWAALLLLVIVLFQQELREAFGRVSPSRLFGHRLTVKPEAIEAVIQASFDLATREVGALIALQRQDQIDRMIRTGVPLSARLGPELLVSLFLPDSPLHDGAVLVRGEQILSAGGFLPLTTREDLPPKLGTRHRAALGLAERSDAAIIVVSEETGEVSLAIEGQLLRDLTRERLRVLLGSAFRATIKTGPPVRFRERFSRHWPLKLVATALVVVGWVLVKGADRVEMVISALVQYTGMRPKLLLVGGQTERVEVRIRAPRLALSALDPKTVQARIDLSGAEAGGHVIPLTRRNFALPVGAEVVQTDPSVVRVKLEPIRRVAVPVKAELRGRPPDGYLLTQVTVQPPTVEVEGAESIVTALRSIPTEPIDLSSVSTNETRAVKPILPLERVAWADGRPAELQVTLKVRRGVPAQTR